VSSDRAGEFIHERLCEAGVRCYYLMAYNEDGSEVMRSYAPTDLDQAALDTLYAKWQETVYEGEEGEEWQESD